MPRQTTTTTTSFLLSLFLEISIKSPSSSIFPRKFKKIPCHVSLSLPDPKTGLVEAGHHAYMLGTKNELDKEALNHPSTSIMYQSHLNPCWVSLKSTIDDLYYIIFALIESLFCDSSFKSHWSILFEATRCYHLAGHPFFSLLKF